MLLTFTNNLSRNKIYILILGTTISIIVLLSFYASNIYTKGTLITLILAGKEGKTDCVIPPFRKINDFFKYGKKKKYKCENLEQMGIDLNGKKFVCLDEIFEPPLNKCDVLSFGMGEGLYFAMDMAKIGCTVYSFDPTRDEENFDLAPNWHFYNLGLSKSRINDKFDRYENILKMLNMTDKKIDYLRIDIGSFQFEFFEDIFGTSLHLLQNVDQLSIKIYTKIPPDTDNEEKLKETSFFMLWKYFHELECIGFQLLRFVPNCSPGNFYFFRNKNESECYEVVWVKH